MTRPFFDNCIIVLGIIFLIVNVSFAQEETEFEKQGDIYLDKCAHYAYIDLDSFIYYSHLAITSYHKAKTWEKYIYAQNALCTAYYSSGDFLDYKKQIEKTIEEADELLPENSSGLGVTLSNYSIFLRGLGNYEQAIHFLKRALKIEMTAGDTASAIVSVGNLGTNYFQMGDYNEALKYYFKVETMGLENESLIKTSNWVNLYNKIGRTYLAKSELDSAEVYFKRSLSLLPSVVTDLGDVTQRFKIDTHLFLAKIYLQENNYDELTYHVDKALNLTNGKHANKKGAAYQILGEWYLQNEELNKATDYFSKSKQIAVKKYEAYEKHYIIAEKDIQLANIYRQTGDYKLALEYYQNAIRELSQHDPGDNVYARPTLENIYSHLDFLDALTGKAQTFFELYEKQGTLLDLKSAYASFEQATKLIKKIRQDYQQEGSMLQLSTRSLPVYEGAIKTALARYNQEGDKQYLHQAFTFSESNKAMILLESMNNNTAKGYAGIPDSLLEKENNLRLELSFYAKKLYEEQNKNQDQNAEFIRDYKDRIFDLDQACKALVGRFEKEYPEYHQLKFNTSVASVKEIQDQLRASEQSVLIEYFFGEQQIYIFSISSSTIEVKQLERKPELIQSIQDMRLLINTIPVTDIEEAYHEYVNNAVGIYQELLEPVIPESTQKLIIIADDLLAYLPLEALLMKRPKAEKISYSLNHLDYLLEAYEISYSYSATLLLQKNKRLKEKPANLFLGVAPDFKSPKLMAQRICTNDHLYALKCNGQEVEDIRALEGGNVLVENEATRAAFEQHANEYRILHLATHACLDDERPEFSKIYFKDDYLTNNDLHNLKLNSELAVLSACDTGSGQLAKGEGVMSLARGFIHAGCPSVVMSLWSVDDCATSDIMRNFYEYLFSEASKSLSLRQAKLDYIQNAKKANQHPYYWAAFVQVGDTTAIQLNTKSNTWIYYLFLPLLILSFWFFLKKR